MALDDRGLGTGTRLLRVERVVRQIQVILRKMSDDAGGPREPPEVAIRNKDGWDRKGKG